MFQTLSWLTGVIVAACITLAGSTTYASQIRTVSTVDGWTIKSRDNAEGKFVACSMERFFQANKGAGRFRLNIIAWPTSVIVLLRGNNGFLEGKGVGSFDIVSDKKPLFSGRIRFENSEVLFALNGADNRQHVANSKGWSLSMNGKRFARFPMTGAAAAMAAVERCAGLDQQASTVAASTPEPTRSTPEPVADTARVASVSVASTSPSLAGKDELTAIARQFSASIQRPDFRVTTFDDGVLHWVYGDTFTSAATMVTQQAESAASFAAGLSIRPDQCNDSVLTLPMAVKKIQGGEHAAVVSMCRGADKVTVRHVHVATRGGGATYVLNYETDADPDGTGMPRGSDTMSRAFLSAVAAVAGG